MDYQKNWEVLSSIINNSDYLNSYSIDPDSLLAELGVTDIEELTAINNVLVPLAEFRQVQVNTFKQFRDYNQKIATLTALVQNPEAAAAFHSSPAEVLVRYGFQNPQEQQQLKYLLESVKQFQQLALEKQAETMDYNRKMECLNNMLQHNEESASFITNPEQYFANFGISDKQDQRKLYAMLQPGRELQKLLLENEKKLRNSNTNVLLSYQESLAKTNSETVRGFSSTMLMYQISFYTGIALIVAAVVFAVVLKSTLFSIIFGSIGTLELLTFFIANPPVRLQESRSEHTKLNAAFYSWYVDLFNWNSFFLQYSGKGQEVPYDILKKVSDSQVENTRKLMEIITKTQVQTANADK